MKSVTLLALTFKKVNRSNHSLHADYHWQIRRRDREVGESVTYEPNAPSLGEHAAELEAGQVRWQCRAIGEPLQINGEWQQAVWLLEPLPAEKAPLDADAKRLARKAGFNL